MQALLTLLALSSVLIVTVVGASADHLQDAKIRYPYSLIGDDHGVLSEQDLAVITCHGFLAPFTSRNSSSRYWKCFESKNILVQCDSNGEPDPDEGIKGLLALTATEGGEVHDYIGRRALPIRGCRQVIGDIRRRLQGTRYACIMGSFASLESMPPKSVSYSWFFEAIRTRKGCESYFQNQECDLTDLIKRGECKRPISLGPAR